MRPNTLTMKRQFHAGEIVRRRLYPRRVLYDASGERPVVELTRIPNDRFTRGFAHWDLDKSAVCEVVPLDEIELDIDIVEPTGFIFHLSHVGSTLVSDMLRMVSGYQVISEPKSLGDCLFSPLGSRDAKRLDRFEKVIRLFCAVSHEINCKPIFKFPSWALLHTKYLHDRFPGCACCMVYRDPVEVLVSLTQDPPPWLQRNNLRRSVNPDSPDGMPYMRERLEALFGTSLDFSHDGPFAEFIGNYLQALLKAAHASGAHFFLLETSEIANKVPDQLAAFFGMQTTSDEKVRMAEISRYDAKRSKELRVFKDDTARKQVEATPLIREIADEFLAPVLDTLIEINSNHRSLD